MYIGLHIGHAYRTSVKPWKNQPSTYQLEFHLRLQFGKSKFKVEE